MRIKDSEEKPISSRDDQKASEGTWGWGLKGGLLWQAWLGPERGLPERGCTEKRTERPISAVTVAQHRVGEAQVSAWSPKPCPALFEVLLQPTPLDSGEMGGGQEARFQSPLALGGRTAVLRSCWGLWGLRRI